MNSLLNEKQAITRQVIRGKLETDIKVIGLSADRAFKFISEVKVVFSKKTNWFCLIDNKQINFKTQYWKEQCNGIWVGTSPKEELDFSCIILNKNESQLLSCHHNNMIKVWKAELESNQLTYDYTLEEKHGENVYKIAFNESETYLVSCDCIRMILWYKNKQNKWEYLNDILVQENGQVFYFTNENQIVWQLKCSNNLQIFEIQNKKLRKCHQIQFNQNAKNYSYFFFFAMFNQKQKIVLLNHNQYIYIFQVQDKAQLKQICKPIDAIKMGYKNLGTITENGELFIILTGGWLKIYKISQN